MRQGELWAYTPTASPRSRTMLVVQRRDPRVSAGWLLGLEVVGEDPDDILALSVGEHS